ncbi:MAG: PrsW family intramembrane metalloprotease [Candidatus Sungiibacteriota bacterium]
MTAALITANTGYLLLAFLPPIFWLLFYLREDRHPEPKRLLLVAFLGGMAAAGLAVAAELLVLGQKGALIFGNTSATDVLITFLIIALIEEYVKYLPVKFLIEKRLDFNEPVDAMIYMMTAALGFAALENALFLLPAFNQNLSLGLGIATNRFLGANLLHALSSGIVGFFLARAWFHPHRRHFVALGIIIASLLHTLFNTLILMRDGLAQGTWYLILLLGMMAMMVFIDFERLKKKDKG